MNLKKVLTEKSVRIGLSAATKGEVIEELVDMIVAGAPGLNREVVLKAVLDRESQMSTGMKNGIAIPHGKTDAVTELHAVIAVSREPIDFECLDGNPARIFVMTVSPASLTGPHLQFLAEVSGLLTKDDLRKKILSASNESELLGLFLGGK
jgi:mannitol/fructose-specific phosphotransferase system IIA component (Ntr-type)